MRVQRDRELKSHEVKVEEDTRFKCQTVKRDRKLEIQKKREGIRSESYEVRERGQRRYTSKERLENRKKRIGNSTV